MILKSLRMWLKAPADWEMIPKAISPAKYLKDKSKRKTRVRVFSNKSKESFGRYTHLGCHHGHGENLDQVSI